MLKPFFEKILINFIESRLIDLIEKKLKQQFKGEIGMNQIEHKQFKKWDWGGGAPRKFRKFYVKFNENY